MIEPRALLDRLPRPALLAYGAAVAVFVADQITKAWVVGGIFPKACPGFVAHAGHPASYCSIEVLPIFSLSMVWNFGVSFGMLKADNDWMRWALVLFSLAVSAALGWWALKADRTRLALSIGLIMGGALGNAIDRMRFGAVADFLNFEKLFFPWVFNVADAAITVGVILLILDSFLSDRGATVGRDA